MNTPRIQGYDCSTGEHIDREMTPQEIAELPEATDETSSPA